MGIAVPGMLLVRLVGNREVGHREIALGMLDKRLEKLEISQGHMLSEWGTVGRSRHLCGDTSETAEQLVVLPAELANRSGNIYAGLRLLDRAGNVLQGVECGVEVHGASPSVALRRAARASLRNSVCSGFIA